VPDFPPHIGTKSWVRVNSFQTPVRYANLGAQVVQELADDIGSVVVVEELKSTEKKTKATAAMLKALGATSKTLVVDVKLDENFSLSARNIAGVRLVASGRLTARDVMDTTKVIATRAAIERLQEVLG